MRRESTKLIIVAEAVKKYMPKSIQQWDGKKTMPYDKSQKNITIIGVILVVIVLSISVIILVYPMLDMTGDTSTNQNSDSNNALSFISISPDDAYELITNSINLTIIDCRGLEGCSNCQFNQGHLPGAELNMYPNTLNDSTNDILVYSKNGTAGEYFCEQLINNSIPVKIYNLEGGYEAWENAGYKT